MLVTLTRTRGQIPNWSAMTVFLPSGSKADCQDTTTLLPRMRKSPYFESRHTFMSRKHLSLVAASGRR